MLAGSKTHPKATPSLSRSPPLGGGRGPRPGPGGTPAAEGRGGCGARELRGSAVAVPKPGWAVGAGCPPWRHRLSWCGGSAGPNVTERFLRKRWEPAGGRQPAPSPGFSLSLGNGAWDSLAPPQGVLLGVTEGWWCPEPGCPQKPPEPGQGTTPHRFPVGLLGCCGIRKRMGAPDESWLGRSSCRETTLSHCFPKSSPPAPAISEGCGVNGSSLNENKWDGIRTQCGQCCLAKL